MFKKVKSFSVSLFAASVVTACGTPNTPNIGSTKIAGISQANLNISIPANLFRKSGFGVKSLEAPLSLTLTISATDNSDNKTVQLAEENGAFTGNIKIQNDKDYLLEANSSSGKRFATVTHSSPGNNVAIFDEKTTLVFDVVKAKKTSQSNLSTQNIETIKSLVDTYLNCVEKQCEVVPASVDANAFSNRIDLSAGTLGNVVTETPVATAPDNNIVASGPTDVTPPDTDTNINATQPDPDTSITDEPVTDPVVDETAPTDGNSEPNDVGGIIEE